MTYASAGIRVSPGGENTAEGLVAPRRENKKRRSGCSIKCNASLIAIFVLVRQIS